MAFSTRRRGPKRMVSISRYSSTASSSSRSVTKCSWLRSSRRRSPDSLTISIRAGFDRSTRGDRRQRIEEEMRVDLAGERIDARRHQQLFLLLQPVLDAGAVPDLDGHGDAEHRRHDHERQQPRVRRAVEIKARRLIEPVAQALRMISRPIGAASRSRPSRSGSAAPDARRCGANR